MADETTLDSNAVQIRVGSDVNLSDDAAKALRDLGAALAAEQGDEVSGFEFGDFEDTLAAMGMGGMGGGGMGGPTIQVQTNCAIDVIIKIPIGF